jgi:hypothetical protein
MAGDGWFNVNIIIYLDLLGIYNGDEMSDVCDILAELLGVTITLDALQKAIEIYNWRLPVSGELGQKSFCLDGYGSFAWSCG